MKLKRGIIALGLLSAVSLQSWAQQLKGVVIDKNSKETLIGAVISIEGTDVKAVTDVNGNFSFEGLKDGTYTLYIKLIGGIKIRLKISIFYGEKVVHLADF